MTIKVESTSVVSKEAVIATPGDLAQAKPVEDKKPEGKPVTDPATDNPIDEPTDKVVDEAEPSEPEEEDTEELEAKNEDETQDDSKQRKNRPGFRRRIDKLNKKLSLEQQEKEYWRQEALRAQQKPNVQEETATKPTTLDLTKRPKADDFALHDEYVEALTDWKLEQKLLDKEQKQKEAAIKSEVKARREKHQERVTKFAAGHEDWQDVLESVNHIKTTPVVEEAIVASDNGPELMYELAKNPKELQRICTLSPIVAAKEIGKIEARLAKPSETKTSETSEINNASKAPAPISPVRARGASVTKSIYDPNLSQREYERLRFEQIKTARN